MIFPWKFHGNNLFCRYLKITSFKLINLGVREREEIYKSGLKGPELPLPIRRLSINHGNIVAVITLKVKN
jgi:hypothetical protein